MLKNLNIKQKLTFIIMTISSVALLVACAAFIIYDQVNYRDVMRRKMNTLAEIIGNHSTAALIFDNDDDATETLSILLKAEKHILYAAIYNKDDKLFAKYKIEGIDIQALPPMPKEEGGFFQKDHFIIYRNIVLDEERIGKVYIQSSLGEITYRLKQNVLIVISVLFLAAFSGYLITPRLQRVVSEPILKLAETARTVSQEKDYSIRAKKTSEDELGFLTEQFNEMLSQIQNQNLALQAAGHELENRAQRLQEELIQREEAEKIIKDSLEEKDILLKEIHHRVKNNMQVISSLLYLQAKKAKDHEAVELFNESQNRIKAMALIHEKLYQSEDIVHIDISDYVGSLTSYLFKSYNVDPLNISIIKEIGDVEIDIDKAIPCGLIINELVSNSLKYAFPNDNKGEIKIQMDPLDKDRVVIQVKDNGIGLPEDIDIREGTNTLGFRLVKSLTKQLNGNMEIHRNGGTEYKITFQA